MKEITTNARSFFLTMLFIFIAAATSSQERVFTGKFISQPYSKYLNKYFLKYSVQSLDVNGMSTYIKSQAQKAHFTLIISGEQFKIEVELNDIRGENFKAIAVSDKGSIELAQTFANTYKGIENNNHLNIVRLNVDDSTFEGYIKSGKKMLYFDKLNRYVPFESDDKIVVYNADDVIPDPSKKCGAEIIGAQKKKLESRSSNQKVADCHFVEIATEADFEYFQAFGGNSGAALMRIRNILNLVEGLYTSSFDVKFILRYQQIWTTINDPYSGNSLVLVLPQFRDWWNTNMTSIARDETHMFSGRTVADTIGLAWLGSVCNTDYYYSSVVNFSPNNSLAVNLSAHEIGHNFGADHDITCNGKNIMCPNIQGGIPEWSAKSVNEISTYIGNSGSCLNVFFPAGFVIMGGRNAVNFLEVVAVENIAIHTSHGPVQLASNGFGHLEAGNNIVLAPTNPNTVGFLAPEGCVLVMRISDFTNTCDPIETTVNSTADKVIQATGRPMDNSEIAISPNPFNSYFNVSFTLRKNEKTEMIIYDAAGKKIKVLLTGNLLKGFNKLSFDGSGFAAGIYLVEIYFGNTKTVKKIVRM